MNPSNVKYHMVKALFFVEAMDINAADIPNLLKENLKEFVDQNKVIFSVCIPGEDDKINIPEIVEQNNYLTQQAIFWQDMYTETINQEK